LLEQLQNAILLSLSSIPVMCRSNLFYCCVPRCTRLDTLQRL